MTDKPLQIEQEFPQQATKLRKQIGTEIHCPQFVVLRVVYD